MAKQQCAEQIYSDIMGGNRCVNTGKVEDSGKWWCGIHSPEANRKRKAKRKARWAENDARWATKRAQLEDDARKLDAYDALAESHAELIGALEWALPYVQDARPAPADVILTQAVRDRHAKGLIEAKALIRKARKLGAEEK